jgi:D-alanine-D-alanine ligase-like ATP-grasp enzyme
VKDGVSYVLDVNTMPNMHPEKSLLPAILEHDGISLKELLRRKIQLNLEEQLVDESFYDRLLTGIID